MAESAGFGDTFPQIVVALKWLPRSVGQAFEPDTPVRLESLTYIRNRFLLRAASQAARWWVTDPP
jgi:hypothetical protein